MNYGLKHFFKENLRFVPTLPQISCLLYSSVYCPINQTVYGVLRNTWHCTTQYTSHCTTQYLTLYCIIPHIVLHHTSHCTAQYLTLYCTVYCLFDCECSAECRVIAACHFWKTVPAKPAHYIYTNGHSTLQSLLYSVHWKLNINTLWGKYLMSN